MNGYLRKEMQKRNLGFIVANSGFQATETFFPYTSGEIGNYYIHSEYIQHNPEHYRTGTKDLYDIIVSNLTRSQTDFISGGERRDWMFSLPVAMMYRRPHLSIYKDKTTSGLDIKGKTGSHVADLNNEGSSPRDLWIPAVKNAGGKTEAIFFYVDRLEDGVKVMDEFGLNHDAVVPLNGNAWEYLLQKQVISKEIYCSLMKRLENKTAWAIEMLKSKEGLEKLAGILKNPQTKSKGEKILIKYYPELYYELTERLRQFEGLKFFGFPSEDTK